MTYLELKDMYYKCNDWAMFILCNTGICYFLTIMFIGFASSTLLFAIDLAIVMTIVLIANMVPVIFGSIMINLYLTDEMKTARMEEKGM